MFEVETLQRKHSSIVFSRYCAFEGILLLQSDLIELRVQDAQFPISLPNAVAVCWFAIATGNQRPAGIRPGFSLPRGQCSCPTTSTICG